MKRRMRAFCGTAALVLFASLPAVTRADIVIDAVETGGDVVFSFSGSIDTSALGAPSFTDPTTAVGVFPQHGSFAFGEVGTLVDFWAGYGLLPFGTGGVWFADSVIGDGFGLSFFGELFIEDGYVSGSTISGSFTFDNATFATLGLTPGTYEHPRGEITFNIGSAQIPEPTTLALLGLGLAGLGFSRRKRAAN